MERSLLLSLAALLISTSSIYAQIDPLDSCRLVSFFPFSIDDNVVPIPINTTKSIAELAWENDISLSNLASAMLAMRHFNERNSSVVPEIDNLSNCTATFDLENSHVLNAGRVGHNPSRMLRKILEDERNFGANASSRICALAGPSYNRPARELSGVASTSELPIVINEATYIDLTLDASYPYTTQVYPQLLDSAYAIASWLQYRERTDYVAILYSLSSSDSWQLQQHVSSLLELAEIETRTYGYRLIPSKAFDHIDSDLTKDLLSDNLDEAIKEVKDSGFRTIVVLTDEVFVADNFVPRLAEEAAAQGLTNGDHLWVFTSTPSQSSNATASYLEDTENSDPSAITKLLAGSAAIVPLDGADVSPKFVDVWRDQTSDFADQVLSSHPILAPLLSRSTGDDDESRNFFPVLHPAPGSGFMYEAIMAIGFGMCNAEASLKEGEPRELDPKRLLNGIRFARFIGTSGYVSFDNDDPRTPGARRGDSILYGVWNLLPLLTYDSANATNQFPAMLSDYLPLGSKSFSDWVPLNEFRFADGRTVPPDLLRDTPEQNHLLPSTRILGFTLFGISSTLIIASAIWVIIFREHAVVKAAQPELLLTICLGSMLVNLSIIMLSFDEGVGWSEEELGRACTSIPWLGSLGVILCYGALFTKLWRVNKVLQFSRTTIKIRHVVWPFRAMFFGAIVLLTIWTVRSPFEWKREEIDEDTGESIGRCYEESGIAWLVPVAATQMVAILLTFIMAWKTKDVDSAFSEAKWIFAMIFVQLQSFVVSVPLIVILSGISPNGAYIGFILITWTFPMSTMTLIMTPKFMAFYRSKKPKEKSSSMSFPSAGAPPPSRRGTNGGVRVSGLNFEVPSQSAMDLSRGISMRPMEEPSSLTKPSHTSEQVRRGNASSNSLRSSVVSLEVVREGLKS